MNGTDSVSPKREDSAELNAWARQVCQTYVYWYTGFFAFNATALSFVVTRTQPAKLWPVCVVFVIFNILGVASSAAVASYGRNIHERLEKSVGSLSPMPIVLWRRITGICGVSLFAMAVIWLLVMIRTPS